jgi:threonine dehydratase
MIVVAHAIAHGLVQHARAPHGYSPLKTFADLADLAQAGHGAFEQAGPFLTAAMTVDDLTSAITLARALQQGDLEAAMRGPSGVLLRHALASQLDRGYATRLLLRMLTQPGPTSVHLTAGRLLVLLREVWEGVRSWALSARRQA